VCDTSHVGILILANAQGYLRPSCLCQLRAGCYRCRAAARIPCWGSGSWQLLHDSGGYLRACWLCEGAYTLTTRIRCALFRSALQLDACCSSAQERGACLWFDFPYGTPPERRSSTHSPLCTSVPAYCCTQSILALGPVPQALPLHTM
jgi:hypothetical protein